eukprot:SAG31_NODE_3197_length_4567_cov_2.365040_3_plen_64_part_00
MDGQRAAHQGPGPGRAVRAYDPYRTGVTVRYATAVLNLVRVRTAMRIARGTYHRTYRRRTVMF